MKRYIRSSTTSHDVFDTTTTHMSYYDRFLNAKDLKYMQEEKNLDGKIAMMTPDEYFKGAAKTFGYKYTTQQLEEQRSDSLIPEYVEAMKNGEKFPLCFLNYADNGQEGLHRMLAAKIAFGPNVKYPVLVITPYDQERWDSWKLAKEINDFERYDLNEAVEAMERSLEDWSSPPPDDLTKLAKSYIEDKFAQQGIDATVECVISDYDGHPRLDVTLVSYKGQDLEDRRPSTASPWLENMFDLDVEDDKHEEDMDDFLEGLDDSDLELEEFLNK